MSSETLSPTGPTASLLSVRLVQFLGAAQTPPTSVEAKGYVAHEVDQSTIPSELKIIQRGKDRAHFEIVPARPGTLSPAPCEAALRSIRFLS
jgi:hypothetical protein